MGGASNGFVHIVYVYVECNFLEFTSLGIADEVVFARCIGCVLHTCTCSHAHTHTQGAQGAQGHYSIPRPYHTKICVTGTHN